MSLRITALEDCLPSASDAGRPTNYTEASFAEAVDRGSEFALFADNLPTPCWIANADGYIFWFNRSWYDYTGATPSETEGWGWRSIHDPERLPAVLANWTSAIEAGVAFEMNYPLRGADGSYRAFLTRVSPVRDAGGRLIRWYGVNSDVSGEVLLASRLSDSEAALMAFFETSGLLTAIIDLDEDDFTFVLANRRMARFWGNEGVAGRTARSLTADRLHGAMLPTMHAAHVSGRSTTVEYPFKGPDGERWFTATLTPMPPGASGKPRLSIASLDITPRKRAEAALAEAVEAKDLLLHEVNHRVKNSLQLVTALLSLQAAQSESHPLRASLLEARGRVAVVASMHQRLYSTSAHDRVEVVGYLRDLAAENIAAHDAHGLVTLEFDADDELVLELTRAVPLALIVGELLTNAFKYAFPGGASGIIRVTLRYSDGHVRLEVADNGVGLPEGFSMLGAPSLGMKIVRSLSRQIGANVEFEDAAPGTRFRITLPDAG